MSHRQALEALDRALQDLRGNEKIMGGVVLLLAGDFRQTLPVVPKEKMAIQWSIFLARLILPIFR